MKLHGVIVVDKPDGPTSHDVVAAVRRWVRPSKTGHTGTLDPMATGVLPVCVGHATRLARFLSHGTKRYTGSIILGAVTDTYDARGQVTERGDPSDVGRDAVAAAAAGLTGEIDQVPPAWSAKKIGGRRAYDLAREGRAPALAAVKVRVERFEILEMEGPVVRFEVACSPGTYIRSLAHELGRRIGCGAHLGSLRRTRSGPFVEEQARGMKRIEEELAGGRPEQVLLPLESLDLGMPSARLPEEHCLMAAAGRSFPAPAGPALQALNPGQPVRLVAPSGRLVGVAEAAGEAGTLQPRVIFPYRPGAGEERPEAGPLH